MKKKTIQNFSETKLINGLDIKTINTGIKSKTRRHQRNPNNLALLIMLKTRPA